MLDLVEGLAEDVPALPHARYRLVAGTVTALAAPPGRGVGGDGLVRTPRRTAGRAACDLFPGAELLHVPGAGHFDLLNHPRVAEALRGWLA